MKLDPQKTAFLFPGQGSQFLGMGHSLAEKYPIAQDTFDEADQILGFPLSQIMWEDADALNDTANTQPALFVHSVAARRVFSRLAPEFEPASVGGHSLGELTALTVAGSLSFSDGLRLVRKRGELMRHAGEIAPGGMAAILGVDIPALENICAEASNENEIVQVANDNCPGQIVVSGSKPALERALVLAKDAGARRAVPLAVSIAPHSALMSAIQREFDEALANVDIAEASLKVVGNVGAKPLSTIEEIKADLSAQLTSRVRWTETIQYMISQDVETFLELGSRNVLTGLLRRIDRGVKGIPLGEEKDFEKMFS
ncbi:MAG: ACP S-malonyltransferase [Chloroflexi bacterium]|nr:ACP S-malonyltransferase [Chloroflexota bacterium]